MFTYGLVGNTIFYGGIWIIFGYTCKYYLLIFIVLEAYNIGTISAKIEIDVIKKYKYFS